MRRIVFVATLLLAVGVAFYLWPRQVPEPERVRPKSGATSSAVTPATSAPTSSSSPSKSAPANSNATPPRTGSPEAGSGARAFSEEEFPIVAKLNTPQSNIARDLDLVRQLFENWQSNFPREGNPVGENAEITAALMGENRLGLALIPKNHPALNADGELCDRWGTPFRFHQLSGTRMEIRSAGPDRKFATEDDAVWTPQ